MPSPKRPKGASEAPGSAGQWDPAERGRSAEAARQLEGFDHRRGSGLVWHFIPGRAWFRLLIPSQESPIVGRVRLSVADAGLEDEAELTVRAQCLEIEHGSPLAE